MTRPRLIPVLLLDRDRRLVKTIGFGPRTYIGDPFNVLRLLNEKEVDEIFVLDIDATIDERVPNLDFLAELASECFVPLSYGGGLNSLKLCEELVSLGVEKLVFGTSALQGTLVSDVSRILGAQAVIGCLDYRDIGGHATVFTHSGSNNTGVDLLAATKHLVSAGCGEIILQSITLDGARTGFDCFSVAELSPHFDVPFISLGGAGSYDDFIPVLMAGASAAASGSAFCFLTRMRAVLVNYPDEADFVRIANAVSKLDT
jgi:cyclase